MAPFAALISTRRFWKRKRAFFEFSLCLSRACLGKMFTFIDKWLKKPVSYLEEEVRLRAKAAGLLRHPFEIQKNGHPFFECLPCVCLSGACHGK